ncbi:MAG: SDR family oxidoreductase [Myxococcales bacterium]
MSYVITGGTGFIGKHLIDRLVRRGKPIHVIVRAGSRANLEGLIASRWAAHAGLVLPLTGDITEPLCGVSPSERAALMGKVEGLFHLAAIYDMDVDADAAWRANVEGTRHAVELANELGCTLHHVSSIAVTGGVYPGVFREDQFDEGQKLEHPYYLTKFESEALVRRESRVPFRVYRPGAVVGDSKTGEADKVDGPYYSFPLLRLAKKSLPPWLPLIGVDSGVLNIVPVDYVADGLDALAHIPGLDGRAFHLVDPQAPSLYEAMSLFAKAAGAPRFAFKVPGKFTSALLKHNPLANLPLAEAVKQGFLDKVGVPESILEATEWVTRFDTRETVALLAPLGIQCPPLAAYAQVIWDYWEQHLRAGAGKRRTRQPRVRRSRDVTGKRVLITGASSGIGRAVALRVAAEGGVPLMVARSLDKLEALRDHIVSRGGQAEVFACDLNVASDIDALLARLENEAPVDVLVNNAGRSIRRSLSHSYDRLHDFERTMQLNYFGALRLTMGLLPRMRKERNGHVINISSAGVRVNTPRFAAYVASKAAFDAFSRVAAGEVLGDGVFFTTVYMPLVRTEMIAPTKGYASAPALTPEQAASWVVHAMRERPSQLGGPVALAVHTVSELAPRLMERARNMAYRYTPGSTKAKPKADATPKAQSFARREIN